eukprot:TRINITY_DN11204_c0_g1_i1.p1 TRINITY_DN11204_c0_g1~~TRINITY_DN11204_c0_g1_i1.p1  ORF type:complete len:150 (-),score=69.24 TRINITY_DN11204_c0_g1_i1:35-439(-)
MGTAMDLQTANTAINVAIETANGLGVKFCIAVMDSGVNLVAFSRMDGGRVGTIDVAMKKAKTSALFGLESGLLGTMTLPGKPVYGLEHSNGGLITFPGGVPIKNGSGEFIGSIGVSGGTVEDDLVWRWLLPSSG